MSSWLLTRSDINFMVTPCINNAEPFYYQLMHIMLKNTELLKHSKVNKNAGAFLFIYFRIF